MYFERLVLDRASGRVTEGIVAEPELWGGGRLLVKALGKEDHAWTLEVVSRIAARGGQEPAGEVWRLTGELVDEEVCYTLYIDDEAGRLLSGATGELDEVLSALSGLIEI